MNERRDRARLDLERAVATGDRASVGRVGPYAHVWDDPEDLEAAEASAEYARGTGLPPGTPCRGERLLVPPTDNLRGRCRRLLDELARALADGHDELEADAAASGAP